MLIELALIFTSTNLMLSSVSNFINIITSKSDNLIIFFLSIMTYGSVLGAFLVSLSIYVGKKYRHGNQIYK
ncbi:hypothetical protein ACE4V3_04330 [Borrelia recurrentis]|uniref:hypothetical protein n=1 Tax=Borrelia recurrentis TaxID=44449 RepID=UPI0012E9EEC1|nr:hypothetical protein [Borrelia recurrentis]